MTIPAGYSIMPNGLFVNSVSNSGGYSISQAGAVNFLGYSKVSNTSTGYSQGHSGYWYYTDGSGPYCRASDGKMYLFLS